jgi:hypothetical protein
MPYTIEWLIENEVILKRYQGVITAEELVQSLLAANDQIASSPRHLVHMITDVGDVTQGLPVAESVKTIRSVTIHPRAGWSITLREKSMLIRMSIALARSLLKARARTFETLDEAIAHLRHVDRQLTWSKLNKELVASLPSELRTRRPAGRSQ